MWFRVSFLSFVPLFSYRFSVILLFCIEKHLRRERRCLRSEKFILSVTGIDIFSCGKCVSLREYIFIYSFSLGVWRIVKEHISVLKIQTTRVKPKSSRSPRNVELSPRSQNSATPFAIKFSPYVSLLHKDSSDVSTGDSWGSQSLRK